MLRNTRNSLQEANEPHPSCLSFGHPSTKLSNTRVIPCHRWLRRCDVGYPPVMKMLVRWLLLAAALILLTHWNIGISVSSFGSALWAAFVIGLLNAFVRPLLIVLTLPVTVLTLGLFLFIVNAMMFQFAGHLLDDFQVKGFWSALLGSILYSVWGMVIDVALERLMGPGRPMLPPRT